MNDDQFAQQPAADEQQHSGQDEAAHALAERGDDESEATTDSEAAAQGHDAPADCSADLDVDGQHTADATDNADDGAPGNDPHGDAKGDDIPADDLCDCGESHDDEDDLVGVEEPTKVLRVAGMVKRLLEELHDAPLDDAARARLAEIHNRAVAEIEDGLSPQLVEELNRITLPFSDDGTPPSDAELRIAQAQLVGWLEGLFQGLQTAMVAHQVMNQIQVAAMNKGGPGGALPPGMVIAMGGPGAGRGNSEPGQDDKNAPGQYM